MAVFSEGGVTSPDIYIGVSCIFLLLLCTALNSRVFYHSYRKRGSVARTLYLCLSATDLISSWVLLGIYAVNVLREKEEDCKNSEDEECNERYFWKMTVATLGMRIYTVISFTMSFSPAHITAFLASTRYLKIKYPFRPLKLRYVITSLLITISWIPVIVSCAMFIDTGAPECRPFKSISNPFAWNYCPIILGVKVSSSGYFYFIIAVSAMLQIGAMFTSILTTYELIKVYLNPVSEIKIYVTVFTFTMSCALAHITAFLATTRFLTMKYPFLQMQMKNVILLLLLTITWIPRMAVFSEGGVTSPDIYIGVSCICLLLLCTANNSRVFYHNYRKHGSVARTLYLCLSATDLISSWVLLGYISADTLKKKDEDCKTSTARECNEMYYWRSMNATLGVKINTVISFTMSFTPAHITAFLATTRFLKIKYPFLRMQTKHVILLLLLTITWIPSVVSCAMFIDSGQSRCGPVKTTIVSYAWNYCPIIFGLRVDSRGYYLLIIAVPVILQIGAMFTSILTTYELIKVYLNPVSESTGREGKRMKSSMKILLTNLGSFIHVLILTVTATMSNVKIDDHFPIGRAVTYVLFQTIVPALISTLNPLIYILLTPDCDFKVNKRTRVVLDSG
ncbi:hypothetical protein ACHWQZ_G010137 [Mnemiopsis leidyi]